MLPEVRARRVDAGAEVKIAVGGKQFSRGRLWAGLRLDGVCLYGGLVLCAAGIFGPGTDALQLGSLVGVADQQCCREYGFDEWTPVLK